jgi:hypothetical protein
MGDRRFACVRGLALVRKLADGRRGQGPMRRRNLSLGTIDLGISDWIYDMPIVFNLYNSIC